MTPAEFNRAVTWLEERWGDEKVWALADRFYIDFEHLTYGAVVDALEEWYRGGNARAPRPSQLLALANQHHQRRQAAGIDPIQTLNCASTGHRWAHVPEWTTYHCAACNTERPHDPTHCRLCRVAAEARPKPIQEALPVDP